MTSRMQNALRLAKPPANAVGLDRFCELANAELVNCLDWLEAPFPLSYRKKELRSLEQDEYFAPKVYLKSREWFRIEPDDTVNSFSFWYADGSRSSLSSFAYSQSINLVVFVNTERVFTEDNIHSETLINQTLQTLKKSFFFESIPEGTELEVFEGLEDAWEDFDITTVNGQQFIKENYATFRIRFDVVYNTLGCLSCIEPIKPDNKVEREQFTESVVFNGQKYQITTQNKDLNISPAPTGHAQGESTLIQYIDGNGVNSITISGVSVVNGELDNTKRNVVFWLFNNDVSGEVGDKTIVNVVTAPLFNPVVSGAFVDNSNPNILKVTFNKNVNIQNLNGLSLNFSKGQPKTITSFSGSGTSVLSFNLSSGIVFDDEFDFVFNQSNTITDLNGNILVAGVFGVQNNVQQESASLVFRYTFENEDFTDSSGKGNNATEVGDFYTFRNESLIGTKSLDAQNAINTSILQVPVSSDGSFTRVCLFKFFSSGNGLLFSHESAKSGEYQKTLFHSSDDLIASGINLSETLAVPLVRNAWSFVTQTYDSLSGLSKVFVNGVEVAQGNLTITNTNDNIILLGGDNNNNVVFRGLVDLVEYYDGVLSDSQIIDLYNSYV